MNTSRYLPYKSFEKFIPFRLTAYICYIVIYYFLYICQRLIYAYVELSIRRAENFRQLSLNFASFQEGVLISCVVNFSTLLTRRCVLVYEKLATPNVGTSIVYGIRRKMLIYKTCATKLHLELYTI